jgi:hypothetical protein
MLLIKKINLKKKRKQEEQNNLLYTVNNLIELASSLRNSVKEKFLFYSKSVVFLHYLLL